MSLRKQIERSAKAKVAPEVLAKQEAGQDLGPVGTPDNPSNQIFTVANVITLCRFILTIVFLMLFIQHEHRVAALTCYAVAAVTDFLDGQVARRTQTVSWLGKISDPIMDRVLLFTGVLGLVITGELPLWVAIFVIGRDVYLFFGMLALQKYRKRPVDVIYIGKVTTALLMFGFCDLLIGAPVIHGLGLVSASWLPGLNSVAAPLGIFFVYVGIITSTITAVIYTKEGVGYKHEALAAREQEEQ